MSRTSFQKLERQESSGLRENRRLADAVISSMLQSLAWHLQRPDFPLSQDFQPRLLSTFDMPDLVKTLWAMERGIHMALRRRRCAKKIG